MFKTGWKTTEFWVAAASQLLSLLVIVGVVSAGDRATLEGAVTNAVTAVGTLVASALVVWKYIQSRTTVKTTPAVPEAPAIPPELMPILQMLKDGDVLIRSAPHSLDK